jgi:hypothetical protein
MVSELLSMRPDAANGAQEIQRCSRCGPESAGSLAVSNGPVASADESIGTLRDRMLASRYDLLELVIVADPNGWHVGGADVRDVLGLPRETQVGGALRALPATCGACSRALRRLPWVLVALALSALAAAVIGRRRAGAAGQRLFAIFIPLLRLSRSLTLATP